ncbi:hypothetical protein Tsubulata_045422 [Turnera subulata]|uniref:C2 NT-type domain-containing protein n=2 Tax=Turnera subulata TaxID=218843 RepID=A0A9Q0JQA7_9ROSI|nr:hypothetical protein Tsubulata_045422 [Turnera subulata]
MFKLHKHKSVKSHDTFDFKFSSFQVLQVPKGWDRLIVSIVSAETGKTLTKSGKASVRNGSCRWTETFTESVSAGECVVRFVVSMGSVRSGILGEATVNLASYRSSAIAVPVSLPLKKCNYGSVLQVKIQCQTPSSKLREEQWDDRSSCAEDSTVDDNDIENKSDVSDGSFSRSFGSSSSNRLDSASNAGELHTREPSFSLSGSRYSFESTEGSLGREHYSPQSNFAGIVNNQIGRQDSTGSHNGSSHAFIDSSRSNHASFNSKVSQIRPQNQKDDQDLVSRSVFSSPLQNSGSSKDLVEAAEAKIEELRAEARMWEQNARKLMINNDKLQQELDEQSKRQASLEKDLSESRRECDSMKCEIEQLKTLLDESIMEQKGTENLRLQAKEMDDVHKELEDEIKFQKEETTNLTLQLNRTQESNIELVAILQELENTVEKQITEIDGLKQRIEELEKDCSELTDENLELVLKLKESEKDLPNCGPSSNSPLQNDSHHTSEFEVKQMKDQICTLEEELNKMEAIIEELSADHLQMQCEDLEKRCADLELQLQVSKEKTCELDDKLSKCHAREEEQGAEIAELLQQLEYYRGKETRTKDHTSEICTISESHADVGMAILSELYEQIESFLADVKKQHHTICSPPCTVNCDLSPQQIPNATDLFKQNEQAKAILNSFLWLMNVLEKKNTVCNDEGQQSDKVEVKLDNAKELQNKLDSCTLKENTVSTFGLDQECSHMVSKSSSSDSYEELLEKVSEMDKVKNDNVLKEQEVEALKQCQRNLEIQISNLQSEKTQLVEDLDIVVIEGKENSKSLEDLKNEIADLKCGRESQVSSNKILVRKSSELENSISELEAHLFELEKENVQLSERICGLEAQLRYLTDDRESSRLELKNSESHVMNLQEEIRRLESEFEAEKLEMKQKLQDMQTKWLEAQKECEYLKIANPKLQTTAESLIEECSLLQKQNRELRQQKMELHELCTVFEAEVKEYENLFSTVVNNFEALEEKYDSIWEEIASKETAFTLELESLLQENMKLKEKERLVDQIYLEKTVEFENFQRKVARLAVQLSATQDEKELTASEEVVVEMSRLLSDKAIVAASLQEVQGKLKESESNLNALQAESERKVQELMNELASSKQNLEILMADHEKLLELLEDVKFNEEKHKGTVRGLELKLKASEYEKQQVEEEISSLTVQLQRTSLLQDEIVALKRSLNEVEFENQRLAASLQMLSGDYEELKDGKTEYLKKISDMQRVVSDLEDCKRTKVALEEKVLRLEGDLTAKDALGAQDAELKNELARVKRINSELQRKLKYIEEEKQQYLKKEFEPSSMNASTSTPRELTRRQVDARPYGDDGSSQDEDADSLSKIQRLEFELADALEANEMYKAQLKSFFSERCEDNANDPTRLTSDNVTERAERSQDAVASLEMELKDLQERYFDMSLKYAEVEAEREQLVLKLKAVGSNGRSTLGFSGITNFLRASH